MSNKTPYLEIVKEKIGNIIIQSDVRIATPEEIEKSRKLYEAGKCPHDIIVDEPGFLYDFRNCYLCGVSLGTV